MTRRLAPAWRRQTVLPASARASGRWWRRLPLAAVALMALMLLTLRSPASAVVVAGLAAGTGWFARRQQEGRQAEARAAAAPAALDLSAVVLGAGGTVADVVAALADVGPVVLRPAAAAARDRAAAGSGLDQALRWLQAELGPGHQPLTGALLAAREEGGPIGVTLARLAIESSAGRRRLGEARARRLPVLLLAPLVSCSLPAVVVGAVIPLALSALAQLRL